MFAVLAESDYCKIYGQAGRTIVSSSGFFYNEFGYVVRFMYYYRINHFYDEFL